MAKNSVDIEVNCNLSVSRETAECCLKLVEMFVNNNARFGIMATDKGDGTQSLILVDYEGWEHEQI